MRKLAQLFARLTLRRRTSCLKLSKGGSIFVAFFVALVILVFPSSTYAFSLEEIYSYLPKIKIPFIAEKPQKIASEIKQEAQKKGEVLAATASSIQQSLSINIPSIFNSGVLFNENGVFKKDLEVDGTASFNGSIKFKGQDIDLGEGKILASNLITSLTAGDGISVTTGQTPTVKNTGVLSLQSKTGALTFTAGSGISIDGLKITNDDLGSSQKIFKTITVGSTSFSAGSNTDTLTFVSGTGITITPDTSNKKLTLSANSSELTTAAGWTDGGTTVALNTSTDSVGIGIATAATKLHVVGTTEQLRLGYDSTNYISLTTSSAGDLTLAPSGSDTSITGTLGVSGATTLSTTLGVTGNTTLTGDLAVNGGDLTTSATTFNLLNATATTLNIGGAATTVSLGAGTGTSTINNNLTVSGTSLTASSAAGSLDSLTVGGGYGSTGVSISNAGNIQANGALTVDSTSTLSGATTIAPTASGATSLTIRASTTSPGNILNLTNSAGSTSYLSVDSSGALTVGGSTLTNAGLLASSGAIHLTTSANAIVGTAIEGGWTMNSNTFTYRRTITVTNNDSENALPANYEVTVTISDSAASQIYSNTQADSDDFRIAYSSDGVTFTEVLRNITTYTSSSIVFTYQLSAEIAASGTSSNYYIYYKNSSLACSSCTYTGNVQIDTFDSATSNWTSADATQFPLADETSSPAPQEGTGSLQMDATVDNIGTFSTSSQNALSGTRTNFGFTTAAISGTTYLYAVGGSTDGTAGNAQTTVLRTSAAAASGNVAAWTQNANSLEEGEARMDNTVAIAAPAFDGGTGADGAIDLASGGGAGGCTGTGLTWDAGSSTCTIATATKSTFNFTTIDIPVGTTLTTDGPKTTTNFVTIKATGAVTVAGTINLAGTGYSGGSVSGSPTAGYGPGAGGVIAFNAGGGGGGYGGVGGAGGGFSGSQGPYGGAAGSTYEANDSGSGGGGANATGTAGAGGGGIKISSGGTVTLSGTINANGGSASNVSDGNNGGGGSGGRIAIQGSTVTVSGTLSANGGNGGNPGSNGWGGGGGGGGRITLEYNGSLNTTGSTITVTNGTGYRFGANGSSGASTNTASNPTLYSLGGKNTSGTAQSGISQATVTASDGSVGTFSASSTSLPQALYGHTSNVVTISNTNYLYIVGGHNGTSDQTTVYKGTFSGSDISAIATTSQTQLGTGISYHAAVTGSISSTNYIWVLGGINGSTVQTSVYRGTIDASGNITALSTTSQGALPQALYGHKALFVTVGSNNYIYVYGGMTTGGTRQTTVYKAAVDGSGNVGTFTTVAQTQLSTAISDFGAFSFTDSDSKQYAYIVGGNTGTVQSAVMKTQYSPIDQTGYSASRTITSTSLTNKNDLQFKVYSSRTGSYMNLQFYDATGGWQTCTFSVSVASTWETKTCDISGVSSANRDAVTSLKIAISSSTTTAWTAYFDDLDGLTEASTISNSAVAASTAVLGASNLTLNAQGTGAVLLNYDNTNSQAGTAGMIVYNGAATKLFEVNTSGSVIMGNAAIATSATDGFLYLASMAGSPAGTPTANTGRVAMVYDTTNNKLCAYNAAWKCSAALSDWAEWAPAKDAESGDIVSVTDEENPIEDNTAPFMLGKSTKKYDSKMTGVVSVYAQEASMAAGYKKSPDYKAIALVGRVPVKIASTSAAIKPGDFLTSSSEPGKAMKATKAGFTIGQAVQAWLPNSDTPSIIAFIKPSFADPQDILTRIAVDKNGYLSYSNKGDEDSELGLEGALAEVATVANHANGNVEPMLKSQDEKMLDLESKIASLSARLANLEASSSAVLASTIKQDQTQIATGSATAIADVLGLETLLDSTTSASLASLSEASMSGTLLTYDFSVSNIFKSLGESLLGNTTIAGSLSVDGTTTLTGTSLSSVGTLYLQDNPLADAIDIFKGKIAINNQGDIATKGEITTKKLVISGQNIGTDVIPAGKTKVTVLAPDITSKSKILITPDQMVTIAVTTKDVTNKGFTVEINQALPQDLHFDWWIVDSL